MKPNEYIDAAKARLNIKSDYEIAKRFSVSDAHISEMKSGKRAMPLDVAYKLAITLELDPAMVVADLEQQREKNPQRLEFWKGFISRAVITAMVLACTLALNFSATCETAVNTLGGKRRRFHCA